MPAARYPFVLTDRLGEEVYRALTEMADDRRDGSAAATDEKFATMTERFERRLSEECGLLRQEIYGVRAEMGSGRSDLSTEIGSLRTEVATQIGGLRTEVASQIGSLRTEIAHTRASLMKWAMVFWVSQAAAVAGIVMALR